MLNAINFQYTDIVEFLEFIKTEDYKYEKFYLKAWSNVIHHRVNEILTESENEVEERINKDLSILQVSVQRIFLLRKTM